MIRAMAGARHEGLDEDGYTRKPLQSDIRISYAAH